MVIRIVKEEYMNQNLKRGKLIQMEGVTVTGGELMWGWILKSGRVFNDYDLDRRYKCS